MFGAFASSEAMSADNRPSTESRLRALQDLALPDDAADIEGPTLPLGFDAGYDLNFKDAQGLESKWAEECTALAEIEDIVKKGDNFISMLYSWRSITNPGVQVRHSAPPHTNTLSPFSPLCPPLPPPSTLCFLPSPPHPSLT